MEAEKSVLEVLSKVTPYKVGLNGDSNTRNNGSNWQDIKGHVLAVEEMEPPGSNQG